MNCGVNDGHITDMGSRSFWLSDGTNLIEICSSAMANITTNMKQIKLNAVTMLIEIDLDSGKLFRYTVELDGTTYVSHHVNNQSNQADQSNWYIGIGFGCLVIFICFMIICCFRRYDQPYNTNGSTKDRMVSTYLLGGERKTAIVSYHDENMLLNIDNDIHGDL